MTTTPPILFAAIMAAGRSSRFGSAKQVAAMSGETLAQRAAATAQRVCGSNVLAVIGHERAAVFNALRFETGFVVVNEDYEQGLGSSIATAARACRDNADAVLLLLADQVLVTPDHLQTMIDRWSGSQTEIVATAFSDTEGPPVLFPGGTFDALCALTGDKGARTLFDDSRFQLKTVRFEDAEVDIDTPDDLAAIT